MSAQVPVAVASEEISSLSASTASSGRNANRLAYGSTRSPLRLWLQGLRIRAV